MKLNQQKIIKKDRIKSSGDKERIELMSTNLRKYTKGGMRRGATHKRHEF